jgi:hypothetical protein
MGEYQKRQIASSCENETPFGEIQAAFYIFIAPIRRLLCHRRYLPTGPEIARPATKICTTGIPFARSPDACPEAIPLRNASVRADNKESTIIDASQAGYTVAARQSVGPNRMLA